MNLKRTLKDRMARTLILSMAFFLSGLAFFSFRMFDEDAPREAEKFSFDSNPEIREPAQLMPAFAKYPEPEVFHHFTYTRGQELTVNGTCKDTFYVILIFHEDMDYRASPLDARFNTAYPCVGGSFSESIPIDTLFLEEKEGYYVIKAHQGTTGVWHDPY